MPAPSVGTLDFSQIIGTTAVWIFTPGQVRSGLSFMRIWNVAAPGAGIIWLSRKGIVAAPNTAGCFFLLPGQYELFTIPQAIPTNPLSAVATVPSTPLTVEVG
jgi:hypothetical protein